MVRGRGYSSSRSSYRGSSTRGNSSWGGGGYRGGYSGSGGGRYSSFSMDSRSPYESKSKYSNSDRFSRSDDFHKSYRSQDSSYMGRDSRRSPERKRQRIEASGSRHDSSFGSYGSGRHEHSSGYRRGYSGGDHRHPSSSSTPYSRRSDDFRRPMGRGGPYRGRVSARSMRGMRGGRDRRPLLDTSYGIRKRIVQRPTDYARKLKISRLRSAIVARRAADRSDKEESDDDDEDDEKPKEKSSDKEEDDEKAGEEKEEGGETIKKESPEKAVDEDKKRKRTFIKLVCPHCSVKVITFRKYEIHLQSRSHLIAMRKVAIKQKAILSQMRQAQRNSQNEMEKSSDDLITKTNFCPLCKLNYKQKKAVHQLSEAHKNMKKFLMPYCKVCNVTFKSPMIYENHCCSIDHIKRKQRMENSDGSGEEELELENFTTIDSVGDVDGDGSDVEAKKAAEEEEDDDEEEGSASKDAKEPVNVGIEQIRKIEAHYCDLCRMYLPRPRGEEEDVPKILARHCKQRIHMQRYIRLKERQDLEKRAEKLQRKELAEKEVKVKVEKDSGSEVVETKKGAAGTKESAAKVVDDDEMKDDKLWADVDKDLGDILAEAESGNKSSDEDEDSHVNGERYDRFKLSEKNGDEKLMTADEESMLDNKLLVVEAEEKK